MRESFLLVRPYYGINVHSDAQGEFGSVLKGPELYPDLPLINAATILNKSSCHEVRVIDAQAERIPPDELINMITKDPKDKVIVKTSSATMKCDIELMKRIKKATPSSALIIAGQATRPVRKWIEDNTDIDRVLDEPLDLYIYKYVTGHEGTIDDFPSPDYGLVNYLAYKNDNKELRLTLQASRGCPMGCSYCPYIQFYNACQTRSTDKVIEDMKQAIAFGAEVIQFRDQFFTFDIPRTRELCRRIIEEGINIPWICETRLDSLDEDTVTIMKKAGLHLILFGVESGDEQTLNEYNSNKGDLAGQQKMVKFLRASGIKTMAFYIFGFPNDTEMSLNRTYQYSKAVDSDIVVYNEFTDFNLSSVPDATPDIYCQFGNSTNTNLKTCLTQDEVRYLVRSYSELYTAEHDSPDKAYSYNYVNSERYQTLAAKLAACNNDLDEISRVIKEL